MGTRVPAHLQAIRAVMNLTGNAANWFCCTGVDPAMITWQQLVNEMRVAFCPADFAQRARDWLEQCMQTGSVEAYTTAFRTLLECTDVDDSEAIQRYISGLKTEPRNWVRMMIGNESPSLQHAAQIAERYDNTHNRQRRPSPPH